MLIASAGASQPGAANALLPRQGGFAGWCESCGCALLLVDEVQELCTQEVVLPGVVVVGTAVGGVGLQWLRWRGLDWWRQGWRFAW